MAATQLSFTLRTSPNCKTVHLLGSWDGYKGQLPLSKDPAKAGSWKGTFRFQGSTLQSGKRYWYYYIMDGFHVSHDPAKPSTKEPTTGRQLNILDAPKGSSGSPVPAPALSIQKSRPTVEIPTGRGLSPSRIAHPKPSKPYASRGIREADYTKSPVDDVTSALEKASLYDSYSASPPSSVGSSLSSRSGGSSPSSLSSLSDRSGSSCRCNRFGITRRGEKVRLDCGGSRCGYSDDSSCSSEYSSDDEPVSRSKPKVQEIRPRQKVTTSSRRR
ncbi:MAG: hypothetical protein LQ340_003578 [Diploschistes diacapsis]|nr:MAG: hypothetical protein LQ340_003578 [Diploschistes diacapsis]